MPKWAQRVERSQMSTPPSNSLTAWPSMLSAFLRRSPFAFIFTPDHGELCGLSHKDQSLSHDLRQSNGSTAPHQEALILVVPDISIHVLFLMWGFVSPALSCWPVTYTFYVQAISTICPAPLAQPCLSLTYLGLRLNNWGLVVTWLGS